MSPDRAPRRTTAASRCATERVGGPVPVAAGPAELDDVQGWMSAAVLAPRDAAADLAAGTRLVPSATLGAAERLDVYRRMVAARFEAVLLADFGAVADAVGPEAFERLALAYVRAVPSRSFTLARLADRFPAFLSTWTGLPRARRAALADLARLEAAEVRVAVEPETPPVAADVLAGVPAAAWARTVLVPVPHLALETFAHDVVTAHEGHLEGRRVPIRRRPCAVAVVRRGGRLRRVALSPAEHALLVDLVAGTPLGAAVAANAAAGAPSLLHRAFEVGLFADVDVA